MSNTNHGERLHFNGGLHLCRLVASACALRRRVASRRVAKRKAADEAKTLTDDQRLRHLFAAHTANAAHKSRVIYELREQDRAVESTL